MAVDDTTLRLDGSAMAGLLRELFVDDVTAAQGACASCGSVARIGEQQLYMFPRSPGAVLRCAGCENVLIVMVHREGCVRLGLQGLAWLEVRQDSASE